MTIILLITIIGSVDSVSSITKGKNLRVHKLSGKICNVMILSRLPIYIVTLKAMRQVYSPLLLRNTDVYLSVVL